MYSGSLIPPLSISCHTEMLSLVSCEDSDIVERPIKENASLVLFVY
jgi:hypothetical protein